LGFGIVNVYSCHSLTCDKPQVSRRHTFSSAKAKFPVLQKYKGLLHFGCQYQKMVPVRLGDISSHLTCS
jgi:hypothetical protein